MTKENAYEYTTINHFPSSKECEGMLVKSLEWGDATILNYKNNKNITILFHTSGGTEVVQKAALATGNICDKRERVFQNLLKKDKRTITLCQEQIKKAQKKIKSARARMNQRNNTKKNRVAANKHLMVDKEVNITDASKTH